MIEDVERGSPGYSMILVYDISRWGRFQDADESAYYEYRCRRASIAVHYCAEAFANDGSLLAALLKTIKRTMAAEYSSELSTKVFAGQSRLTELGFRQGGTAGYGFRRLLVDHDGKPKFVLQRGERKSIATDRVILIPEPREEIAIVSEVFRQYVADRRGTQKIASMLNKRGIPCEGGRPWTRYIVRRMVTNPKYTGANVTNRLSAKLQGRRVNNPPPGQRLPARYREDRQFRNAGGRRSLRDGLLVRPLRRSLRRRTRRAHHPRRRQNAPVPHQSSQGRQYQAGANRSVGKPGTKKQPGPLYGISGDLWSALAVAVTQHDRMSVSGLNRKVVGN